jgi:hypothetical protein
MVLVLLLIVVAVILVRVMVLQPEWIDLGAIDQLKQETPTQHTAILRDRTTLSVWVVHTEDRWIIFDGRTPMGPDTTFTSHCLYQWQPVTHRFEDPCSGYKFSLTGEFADPYAQFVGRRVLNLNQYLPDIRDGHLFVDANRVIHAEPYVEPGP